MRIIGGREAGTRITTPKGQGVRPTQDRVREAIFNRLAPILVNASVLDLFGGTGAMGLESISRGAAHVLCVEKSPMHGRNIQKNVQTCRYDSKQFRLKIGCCYAAIRSLAEEQTTFDVIFADPPFGEKSTNRRSQSMAQQLLDDPNLHRITHSETHVVVGHATRDKVEIPASWKVIKQQRYGDATINFLQKSAS